MKVLNIVENEDGSADILVEVTDKEKQFLFEYAFNHLLQEKIEKEEEEKFNSEAYTEIELINLEPLNETHFVENSVKEDSIDCSSLYDMGGYVDDLDEDDLFEGEIDL